MTLKQCRARELQISELQDSVCFCFLHSAASANSRAVRNLPLMRSFKDAFELYPGIELHISAFCPNQAEL